MMQGEAGEILEKGRYYCIKKISDDHICAEYSNASQETAVFKLTLTALEPYKSFFVMLEDEEVFILKANAAGILEGRFQIPPGKCIKIENKKNGETK